MYTRTQICAHFGISGPTFQRYRRAGIVFHPQIVGKARYYSNEDVRRIRKARETVLDGILSYREYGLRHPHPAAPPPADEACGDDEHPDLS